MCWCCLTARYLPSPEAIQQGPVVEGSGGRSRTAHLAKPLCCPDQPSQIDTIAPPFRVVSRHVAGRDGAVPELTRFAAGTLKIVRRGTRDALQPWHPSRTTQRG